MTATQLNEVAKQIKEVTGEAPTKDFVLSLCIKTLTDAGVKVDKAFDFVLGDGRFDKLADDLYEQFTA